MGYPNLMFLFRSFSGSQEMGSWLSGPSWRIGPARLPIRGFRLKYYHGEVPY